MLCAMPPSCMDVLIHLCLTSNIDNPKEKPLTTLVEVPARETVYAPMQKLIYLVATVFWHRPYFTLSIRLARPIIQKSFDHASK